MPATIWSLLTLCAFAVISNAACANNSDAFSPWQGMGIGLGFLDQRINASNCARSNREFLSCIGAVQRVLDVEGRERYLIPTTNITGQQRIVERFGDAAAVKDPALRIDAEGNALAAIRARTHLISSWRDRLDPSLRRSVDFTAIRNWLKKNVIDPRRQETFAAAAVNGYLGVADAHARIAPASSIPDASGQRGGDDPVNSTGALIYTGIGAGVQPIADAALVTTVVRHGPAARAGLRVHDFILAIDGETVTGLSADTLVERLRGRDGTRVAIKFKRQDEVKEVSVRRNTVTVKNVVSSAFVDRGWHLAYLRIDGFLHPDTCQQVRRELAKRLKPNLNGLLLDLRNNAGGLIDQAVCVADLLLPANKVVIEVRSVHGGDKTERIRTKQEGQVRFPVVTLVNATTGSASEVLSGALQDHSRSLLVGELTFGKGTVQTVRPWEGSRSIIEFYTTARYYRPSGVGVQLIGIEPDIEVFDQPGPAPSGRIVLRERDLFPTALPRERQLWTHPNPLRVKELRECTMQEGLARHRMGREAEKRRATDYQLTVGQDALVCILTHPLR